MMQQCAVRWNRLCELSLEGRPRWLLTPKVHSSTWLTATNLQRNSLCQELGEGCGEGKPKKKWSYLLKIISNRMCDLNKKFSDKRDESINRKKQKTKNKPQTIPVDNLSSKAYQPVCIFWTYVQFTASTVKRNGVKPYIKNIPCQHQYQHRNVNVSTGLAAQGWENDVGW